MWLLCALCRLKSVCCLFSAPVCKEIKLVTFILSFILLSPKDYISTTVDTWSRHLGNTPRPPPIRPFIYFYLFIAKFKFNSRDSLLVPRLRVCEWSPPTPPAPTYPSSPPPERGLKTLVLPEMRSLLPLSVYCISLLSLQQLEALPAQERPGANR